MAALVVCGDGDVDEFGGGIGVAESDDGDVDVAGFFDGLGVGAWIRYDDESGFFEGACDVVCEVSGGEAAGDGDGAGVSGKFEDGTLAVGTGGDDGDVSGVVDGGDDAGCEDDFFPAIARLAIDVLGLMGIRVARMYQVLPMLITLIPSGRVFHRYGSIWT